jgi:hypothetical protein
MRPAARKPRFDKAIVQQWCRSITKRRGLTRPAHVADPPHIALHLVHQFIPCPLLEDAVANAARSLVDGKHGQQQSRMGSDPREGTAAVPVLTG